MDPLLVRLNLNVSSREEVIEELAALYYEKGIVTNKQKYIAAVNQRESDGTTGIGDGIAIPHGKSSVVSKAAVAVASTANPIDWNALDDKPVKYIFLLAVPEKSDNTHLELLSELAGTLMDDDVREKLKKVTNVLDLEKIFESEVK
ncbi:PTS system, fructose-specific IIA component [Liquorilactobacillus satsumensis DSM 16230 = JCM 12392]|uniref:PTS system, fructose-specific IIA component n=1 Tax=Liquorilactobacillus satsumensis DSM 16230 = JCM 12392 TaxID=1423801 RepID=A0A0R1UUL4_9LACO|nr:PTS system, fructose-specific IIA component [Liquorilactobacillus satsumensis DSM 16230 = JCM 12392]